MGRASLFADIAAETYHKATPSVVAEVEGGSDYCQIRMDHEHTYLAFRGSDDLQDWVSKGGNINFEMVSHPTLGLVHCGFARGWDSIEGPLREALWDFRGDSIHICGHSRGGALAMLAGAVISSYWEEHGGNLRSIRTFGCPRVGNQAFADRLNQLCPDIKRYENRTLPAPGFRDPVPHMPVSPRYRHAGIAVPLLAFGRPSRQHFISTYQRTSR